MSPAGTKLFLHTQPGMLLGFYYNDAKRCCLFLSNQCLHAVLPLATCGISTILGFGIKV